MADIFTPILSNLRYVPSDMDGTWAGDAISGEIFSLTLPNGTPADYRYPFSWRHDDLWPGVYVYMHLGGYSSSPDTWVKATPDTIVHSVSLGSHFWPILKRGIPILQVQLPTPSATVPVPGGGYYHAPGGAERRWESPLFTNAQKASILAIQYFKQQRKYIDSVLRSLGKFGWADYMAVGGTSAGADMASQVLLFPNRAGELGTSGQYLVDTRVNCGVMQATNVFKPLMFSGAATFFGNLPKSETSTAGATTVISASTNVSAASADNSLNLSAGSWTTTPIVGRGVLVTGFTTNGASFFARVVAATASKITLATWSKVLVNEAAGAAITITTVASEEKAATFSAAPLRYKHAMGSSRHMPRGPGSIPHVLVWCDTAALESPSWGDNTAGVLTVAHAPETFLALKEAAPDRVHLYMTKSFDPDAGGPYAPFVYGIPDGFQNNAFYAAGAAEISTGLVANFILAHLHDPIVQAPVVPRMIEVEVEGRICSPMSPGRKRLVVRNTGDDTTTGSASTEDLIVGKGRYDVLATVAVGESYTIEGYEGPVWCRAATAFAKGELHEDFV